MENDKFDEISAKLADARAELLEEYLRVAEDGTSGTFVQSVLGDNKDQPPSIKKLASSGISKARA